MERSLDVDQSLSLSPQLIFSSSINFYSAVPDECLNEVEGVRHFERIFQARHPNLPRWPVWFKSSLENAINQSVIPPFRVHFRC